MRPGPNAMELLTVSEQYDGLLIREDRPGLARMGRTALFPSNETFPDRLVLSPPTEQFIVWVSIFVNGRRLHAIVDLSRPLGNSC